MINTRRTSQVRDRYQRAIWTIGMSVVALIIVGAVSGIGAAPSAAALARAQLTPAEVGGAVKMVSSGILRYNVPVAFHVTDPKPTLILTATRTPIVPPTATAAPTLTVPRILTRRTTLAVSRPLSATLEPLSFSFYARTTCATRKIQNLTFVITAHGGRPPYDYYNGDVVLARSEKGSVKYSRDAAAGNPVPYKIIIIDSLGQSYSEDFFFKSHLHCGF